AHEASTIGDRGDQLLAPAIVAWTAVDDRARNDIEQLSRSIVGCFNDKDLRLATACQFTELADHGARRLFVPAQQQSAGNSVGIDPREARGVVSGADGAD